MSVQDNKALVSRYMAEGVNKGNVSIAGQMFTSNFQFHFPGVPAPMNHEGWAQMTRAFQQGFPDQHTVTDDLFGEGDKVAARFTFHGTQTGDFQGIPPTGKPVTMTGMAIWRISDGRIAEHWVETDAFGMMAQLGLVPIPG